MSCRQPAPRKHLQRRLDAAGQHQRAVIVVAAPARRLGAEHAGVSDAERQRRDAQAREQVPQFLGQRADDPLQPLGRKVRAEQQDQPPARACLLYTSPSPRD